MHTEINLSSIPLQSLSLLVFLFLINFTVVLMMMRMLMSFPTAYLFDDLPHIHENICRNCFNFSISVNVHNLLPFPPIPASYLLALQSCLCCCHSLFRHAFFLCRFILNPHHNILAENVINIYVHRQWLYMEKERNFQFKL